MKIIRIVALILVLAGLFSLSAFGAQPSEALADALQNENSGELTWAATFTDLVLPEGLEYLYLTSMTEDGFYAISGELVAGSAEDETELGGTYESRILFIGLDGRVSLLENYQPLTLERDLTGRYDYSVTVSPAYLVPLKSGELAVIESVYESWVSREGLNSDEEEYWQNYTFSQEFYFRLLNADGSEKLNRQIPLAQGQYLTSEVLDREGNIVCIASDQLLVLSPEGELLRTIDTGYYWDGIVSLRSGNLFASAWGASGVELYPVDAQKGEIGSGRELPNGAYTLRAGGGKYPLYYSDGSNFYGYDLESGEGVKLFTWLSTDVSPEVYSDFGVLDDGSVVGVINDGENGYNDGVPVYRLYEVRQVPASSVREKKTLTMAVQWLDYDAGRAALRFNRSSDDYRIEIRDYSVYNTDENYNAGRDKLLEDIMGGNTPDILELDNLPVSRLAASGVLEDLYPFMDADPGLSRDDFFPNVLALCERDGNLVSTVSGFWLNTLIGSGSVVGDTPGWTYEEYEDALSSMPAGCRPLSAYTTREDILSTCLGLNLDEYINWATGECDFNNEEFASLLKFASGFPETYDWENYNWETDSDEAGLASGRQMLTMAWVSTMSDAAYNDYYFGGQPYTYIGYPMASGTGNYISLSKGYAMNAGCSDKQAAWQFLRTFFTDDYQEQQYVLPTSRTVFNARLDDAMSDSSLSVLTQEQADKLKELVETTTRTLTPDETVQTIVKEQAEAFFRGEKTIEEVADAVTAEVNSYLNGQR